MQIAQVEQRQRALYNTTLTYLGFYTSRRSACLGEKEQACRAQHSAEFQPTETLRANGQQQAVEKNKNSRQVAHGATGASLNGQGCRRARAGLRLGEPARRVSSGPTAPGSLWLVVASAAMGIPWFWGEGSIYWPHLACYVLGTYLHRAWQDQSV